MTGLLLCAALLVPSARAVETSSATLRLSMREAVALAVENSEDVQMSRRKVERVGSTYVKVRSQALPRVSGRFSWDRYFEGPKTTTDFGTGPVTFLRSGKWDMAMGATMTQVLWSFGKVSTALDIARKAIAIERSSSEAAVNELAFAVKQAYLTILYAQEALKTADESYRNALENQEALRSRLRGGRGSRVDNVKMAADVEGRIPAKLDARSRLDSLLVRFRSLVGASRGAPIRLTDQLDEGFKDLDLETLRGKMLAREPGLRMLRRSIELQERKVRLRRSDLLPTLSAVADYSYSGNKNDPYPEGRMDPALLAGLRLDIPVFSSGQWSGAYHEAKDDLKLAELEYAKRSKELDVALETALTGYVSSRRTLEARRKAAELMEDAYRITLSSFRSGKASQSQLNDAELQLTAAKLKTEESLFAIRLHLAEIERLTGRGAGDS